ncbi:PP2C family protein-serine/threonine phosphatase [Kitasatospora sp. NPDC018058]|uniref:PP2C family protein-serine/threonine phosphatase n=1 Tax=Kitasatospora sp. NPDC018058 TaxID=3364025 RepID=UPI0037C0164A
MRGTGRPAVVKVIARVLGEIREAAQYEPTLAGVAARAEACVSRSVATGVLMTALFAEFSGTTEMVLLSCGHAPAPLVASDRGVRTAACGAGPPVGLAELAVGAPLLRREPLAAGQTLVLCSDGVAEARGCGGARYPLEERLTRLASTAGWRAGGVEERAELLRSDLLAFAEGELGDDAVVLLVERLRSPDR